MRSALIVVLVCLVLVGVQAFQLPSLTVCQQRHLGRRKCADTADDAHHQHQHCLKAHPSRRECVSLLSTAVIAIAALTPASRALAASDGSYDSALKYNGVYTDPKHPKGYRVLIGNTKTATIQLQDDPSGEVYNLPVQVKQEDSVVKEFLFDFSPKGGPADVIGVFSYDKEGIPIITFPSNTWKKRETGIVGVYKDGLDPKKVIVIRQFKGPELTVDIITKGKGGGDDVTTTTMKAKAGNPTILFDFPTGGGGGGGGSTNIVPGVANLKRKIISFEDGNVWTKF